MQQTTPHIPNDLPKTKTFSPDLQQAINQIYLWVKDGCSEVSYFSKGSGLCFNIAGITNLASDEVNNTLWKNQEFPFDGSWFAYSACKNKYTNPKRLAWLQEHQTVE